MMTEQRKRRLRFKIQESRARLMGAYPFFALLLMYLKFVAVPGMKKISTNGRCIFFAPEYIDKLYWYELDYILCHQIQHIVHGHIWRPLDLAGDDYHFACDIFINATLWDAGFLEDRYAHLGYVYRVIPGLQENPAAMTPAQIYDEIPYSLRSFDERTRSRFLPDTDTWWDQKDDNGYGGEIIIDLPDLEGMLRETSVSIDAAGNPNGSNAGNELRQTWKIRAAAAAESLSAIEQSNHNGVDLPNFIKRLIGKMHEPKLDWKKILHNFLQEQICDYSFSPPDRRFADTGFFLPDFNDRDFVSREILFMVDTSGSVRDEDLATVYSEIRGAIEQFSGKLTGKLGFFDSMVTQPKPFESTNDLLHIIPIGGGGTDFKAIFSYIRRHYYEELPACIVIFTDGYGPYPDEAAAQGIPVLWLINNREVTPPWGKVTRMIPDEI